MPSAPSDGGVVAGFIVPGLPHPLQVPQANAGYASLRRAFEAARQRIADTDADLLLLYSTQWVSIIGHQIQADPAPTWVHVDQEWHELGEIPYAFAMDPSFGDAYQKAAQGRGLHARTVSYHGFPIDTGTVVALKLLNPDNRLRASVVSCNMYAERAETLVLGKAAAEALRAQGKRAVAVAVTALSNRLHTDVVPFSEDRIHSLKDDEWNRKLLEILGKGRLEDVCQLAREFTAQANGDSKLKAVWWLAAAMGQHNNYQGTVYDYQPLYGTGGAVVGLVPTPGAAARQEYDEEDAERFHGDRDVLAIDGGATTTALVRGAGAAAPAVQVARSRGIVTTTAPTRGANAANTPAVVRTSAAPTPVGAYPHARRVGDLLYLSGIGPRLPGSGDIPGGPVSDATGARRDYDVEAQTRQVIANVSAILAASGSSLQKVLDVTVFLIDMERDFETFNRVYREHFEAIDATRTTLAVSALPTPIAVEFKVIAAAPSA